MFNSKSKQAKKTIEGLFNELKMNLSNHYKDLAHDTKKEISFKLEEYYKKGDIKEKDYLNFKKKLDEYENKMVGYHH